MKTINSFRSKLLALTLALMASVSTFAYDFQSGYLFYNILPDGTVAVTSETYGIPYDYLPNSLVIPSEVNGYNGETYVVTEIANYAFSGCSMLDTLVIPNTIRKIGMYAFTGCTKLVYISFPESIEDILGGALYECAWYNNQPDGLIYIGNLLYRYKGTAPTGTIVVKDGTKAILDFTFSNQPNIQSVVLPESVTSIHIQAFGDCPNLESVVLPSKLEAIEDHTFQYCEKLTNIKLPDALKLIGKNAFIGCTNLTKLTLPSSVQIIEDEAFANCTSLTEVTCYATIPPIRGDVVSDSPSDWFFAGVDVAKIPLYVPTESIDLYKKAEQWMFFNPILPIEPTTDYKSQWCNEWNVMFSNGSVYPPANMPYRYQLAKDTVIGEHTYTAVVQKEINDALDAPRYVAAVRFTDDRKVYIYYDNAEYLLYDFNVQEGDELEVFAGINNYRFGIKTYKCIVTGVEQYACIGCPATITLHVPNHPDDFTEIYRRTQWQEGVGDVYSGFLNGVNGYVPVDGGGSVHLLCAYQGDELKYTGPLYEEYGCGDNAEQSPEDLFPTLWGLQRTDVELSTIEGYVDPYHLSFKEYTPTLVNGKLYLCDGRNYFREENNQVLLYAPYLGMEEDLVLYDWTLEVGDTLPFKPKRYTNEQLGMLFRVTDVSTIQLLDGKEYKKWTFSGGYEFVEGIGAINKGFGHFYCLRHTIHTGMSAGERLVCASRNGQLLIDNTEKWGVECQCEIETSYKSQWCDTWNILVKTGSVHPPVEETYRYQLAQDTVIGDYTYTAVVSKAINDALDAPRYVAAVRFTDDRKVYVYYDNTEYLLYDFNVQEGDELEVFAGINNYRFGIKTYKCIVTGVEQYACIGCPATITLHVPNHPDDFTEIYRRTQWQEGVGDVYSGFLNGVNGYVPVDGGGSVHLLCAYQGDELKYTGDLYEEYGCGDDAEQTPEDLFPTLWGLQRTGYTKTIGENENGTVWGSRSYLMQEIETATIDGKQYLLFGIDNNYDKLYLKLWLREENNKILLYSTAQKKDLVLYDFTLNVGDSLPRLYVDYDLSSVVDYDNDEWGLSPLVVTEVSTITLLDGKEYKKWTFDNGMQYVEGIGSFGTCYAHNDFYQLIANAPLSSDVYSQYLVCASRNGKLLYQMDDTEMERLGAECLCEVEKKWSDTWCNQWNILFHGYLGPQDPLAGARTSIYWLSNNTVNRNGQEYIPLMCSSSLPNEESTHLVGELRFTEDKQVYFYYAFDETEYLLYDFGAELGDTLELFAGLEFYNYHKTYTHVITDKETLDDGRLQIQADVVIRIDNGAGEYFEEKHPVTWIEGLGSTYGIIFNPSNPGVGGDGAIIMLCAYREDECVYTTNFSDYKNMGCVYNNDGTVDEDLFPMLAGLQRTVCNEYCGETEDDNSANNTYKQTFDSIFFENDKPYILCNDYLLREEDDKILIYSQLLNKDLVLYDFTLEVGDSLPALYIDWQCHNAFEQPLPYNGEVVDYNEDNDGTILPADTFIVTDISTITLLDGKEYKKWTFDNGMEYVEGIGMYGGRRNGNFFGLIREVVVPCHTGTHLVCVSKNGKLLYQMDEAEMERLGAECLCDYNSGPKRDNAKDGQIGGRPTPTQWNMLEMELRKMENGISILQAETFSYTLEDISQQVNSRTYFQLARQSTKDTATTKSVVGALHFGEDEDNRVYFLRDGVEYVLYDFTAEIGDTVEIFAGINNYPQETTYTHVVTGKDTLDNGACRMLLEVVFPDETTAENVEKVWLAGLGSVDGIVHNVAKRTNNAHAAPSRSASSSEAQTSVMLCAWREDSCLYTTNHPDYDTFGCVYNQDPTSVENPTSPSSYQKLLRDGQLLIIHNDKIYNVMGLDIGKSSIKIVESLTNN